MYCDVPAQGGLPGLNDAVSSVSVLTAGCHLVLVRAGETGI